MPLDGIGPGLVIRLRRADVGAQVVLDDGREMHQRRLHGSGRAAALADADAGVYLVGAAGECPQHAQGVGFILGFPEHLTAAVHHGIKAEDGIRRVQFGHSAGLGRGQALRQVSRGIGGDLTLVHIAGDNGIVRCDECHQFAAARAAGCQDQCHSRVSFRV